MVIGVITWELHLAGCQSLKDKRRVLKSLKDRLHDRFNVSVAETAHHDLWQRAELACCAVSGDRATVRLAEPVVAAPGQAAVIYDGDRVLAGGWIARESDLV